LPSLLPEERVLGLQVKQRSGEIQSGEIQQEMQLQQMQPE
jgi:hypothetical protein